MEKVTVVERSADGKLFLDRNRIAPGETVSLAADFEYFYFVHSGYGVLMIDAYGHYVEQGSGIYIPVGTRYSFTNTGDIDLILIQYGSTN